MKYFIPIKLNRTFTIGPYSVIDAILILIGGFVAFRFSVIHQTSTLLYPMAAFVLLRLRIEDKTILSRMILRLKFLLQKTQYELKESFTSEKNKNE